MGPFTAAAMTPAAIDMLDFWQRQKDWSYETFGPPERRGPIGPLRHLEKEAKEAYSEADEAKRREEIADCLFLVFDAAHRSGMSYPDLARECMAKLRKNQGRTWPDWRMQPTDQPTEHDRSKEASSVNAANPYITTYTEKQFHLIRPHHSEVDLTSIARSIATKPRYGGHALQTVTVLDHLVLCYHLADGPIIKLHSIMHDMHEPYTGDIVSPLKTVLYVLVDGQFVPIEVVENMHQAVVYQHFGIPLPTPEQQAEVKRIDLLARAIEMRHFYRNHPCLTNGQTSREILEESAKHGPPTIHDQRGAWRLFVDLFRRAEADYWKAVKR